MSIQTRLDPWSSIAHAGRVYSDKTWHFQRVDGEVSEFYIGGYEVLEKWLKETIRLMGEIDEIIPSWPIE